MAFIGNNMISQCRAASLFYPIFPTFEFVRVTRLQKKVIIRELSETAPDLKAKRAFNRDFMERYPESVELHNKIKNLN